MITVYHWPDHVPDCTWSITDALIGEDTLYQAQYFAGQQQPHFPMPVTMHWANSPYLCDHWPEDAAIALGLKPI